MLNSPQSNEESGRNAPAGASRFLLPRCPRPLCNGGEVGELQRLRPEQENRGFRCRSCGHLWSPKLPEKQTP